MFKKNISPVLLVLLVLILVSCNTEKYSLSNESTIDQQDVIDKDIQDASVIKTEENSVNSKNNQIQNNDEYQIIQSNYIDKEMKITYPQIKRLSDIAKQNEINDLIKNEALRVLDYYADVDEGVSLDINYDIKWKGENLLSIQYTGVGYINGAAYPKNIFYTTNVDMNNICKIKLTDYVKIDEEFLKKIKDGKYIAWDTELNYTTELIKKDIKSYNLFNKFETTDYMGEENTSNSFSYFTKDSLGISIGVTHALGDHAEFEIKYQDIKKNIKVENGIWNDVLN